MVNRILNIEIVREYIEKMYTLKPIFSNYYNQPLTINDYFYNTNETLIITKPNEGYNKLFVMSNNQREAVDILKSLNGINVINIPSKGDISKWIDLFAMADYKQIAVYERYYNIKIKQRKSSEIIFASSDQCEEIYNLFHESGFFSPYTDYLPTRSELHQLICQKKVITNELDRKIYGALIFAIEGKKCYFRAWIDKSNNGLKLIFDVYNMMHENGLNYAYFWINSENTNVKAIHKLLGAIPDGLKDYTFIKQS